VADRGYRGHNASPDHKMKVYISGQKREVTDAIKRDLRRRSAVEPVIGHAKGEHRMGRNFLKGARGDAANAAAGLQLPKAPRLAGSPLARLHPGRPCDGER
jgi:IS5 family transposase